MKLPRMWDWVVYASVLLLTVYLLAPQSLPVTVNKLTLAALAGLLGYRLDRSLFPYARPDRLVSLISADRLWTPAEAIVFAAAMLRRAIIVSACVVGVLLGI